MQEQVEKRRKWIEWEYWTTVRYRSVLLLGLIGILVSLGGLYFLRPDLWERLWAPLSGSTGASTSAEVTSYAHFVNLDGAVRVKKHDAVQWINADYRTPLEEGDLVQTGSQGIARINFVDGTTYVVKPRTLIVIEQNKALENRATKVAVQITSGMVDLSTPTWDVPGSSSEVRIENLVARMRQNTRAAIRQNPEAKIHEITISEGAAAVKKGQETIQVGPYERVSFSDPTERLQKEKVIAPPKLLKPRNLEPIISVNPRNEVIDFEWSPVEQARRYRLRLSTSPLFTSMVLERSVHGTSFKARGLPSGEFYWAVRAIDDRNRESQESEANRFTLTQQPIAEQLLLVIESITQHGRVIEIVGRTEVGVTVTVNAEPVAYVGPDGRFRHFTSALPGPGIHAVTVVAQNRRGDVVTRKQTVLVK